MATPQALKQALLLIALSLYTAFAAGPFVWIGSMSLRGSRLSAPYLGQASM